jgi:hypothetical protein
MSVRGARTEAALSLVKAAPSGVEWDGREV